MYVLDCTATHLNAEISSVDVVTKEQVTRRRRRASDFKQFHEVVELAMYVSTH